MPQPFHASLWDQQWCDLELTPGNRPKEGVVCPENVIGYTICLLIYLIHLFFDLFKHQNLNSFWNVCCTTPTSSCFQQSLNQLVLTLRRSSNISLWHKKWLVTRVCTLWMNLILNDMNMTQRWDNQTWYRNKQDNYIYSKHDMNALLNKQDKKISLFLDFNLWFIDSVDHQPGSCSKSAAETQQTQKSLPFLKNLWPDEAGNTSRKLRCFLTCFRTCF